jgi:hypothetical protein
MSTPTSSPKWDVNAVVKTFDNTVDYAMQQADAAREVASFNLNKEYCSLTAPQQKALLQALAGDHSIDNPRGYPQREPELNTWSLQTGGYGEPVNLIDNGDLVSTLCDK